MPRRRHGRKRLSRWGFNPRAYAHIHLHTLFASLGRLWRTPFSLMMTVGVIGITLALPAGMQLTLSNLEQASGQLELNHQVSLFLKQEASLQQARQLADKLSSHRLVETALLIEKNQAMQEFMTYSGFGQALEALENNPLPHVIQVTPHQELTTPAALSAWVKEWQQHPDIDHIQLDMEWLERLNAILDIAHRGIVLLSALLGVAVLLIVGNTIRLELNHRREEIDITRLVGATPAFIRRPFLYCGFWYGLFGGLLACILVSATFWSLYGPTSILTQLYQSSYTMQFPGFLQLLVLILCSVILGVLGAWIVVQRHLYRLETT